MTSGTGGGTGGGAGRVALVASMVAVESKVLFQLPLLSRRTFDAAILIALVLAVMVPPAATTRLGNAALTMLGVPWARITLLTLTGWSR